MDRDKVLDLEARLRLPGPTEDGELTELRNRLAAQDSAISDLKAEVERYQTQVQALTEERSELNSLNQSQAIAMSIYWETLAPGYEGDLKFLDILTNTIDERDALSKQLEFDRSAVADCITRANKELDSRHWLTEGRGSYEWDDDRYQAEFLAAGIAIKAALAPMTRIAADWSGCPVSSTDIAAARIDLQSKLDATTAQAGVLREAAQAVIDRWDSLAWKDLPHTGVTIAALRIAVDKSPSSSLAALRARIRRESLAELKPILEKIDGESCIMGIDSGNTAVNKLARDGLALISASASHYQLNLKTPALKKPNP
jgi:hypothetical protein